MTIKPIYSKEWIFLKKAHKKLLSSLFYFRKTNDLFEQILFALNDDDLSEQATALRFLRNEPLRAPELEMLAPVIIKNLLNKIVII